MNEPTLFQGELMTCCVCGAQEKSSAGKESQWTALELGPAAGKQIFYACPKEFPGEGASAGQFDLAYQRVVRIALEKMKAAGSKAEVAPAPERACRVCGCTENAPCVVEGTPCHWVGEDLCSRCAGPEVAPGKLQLNDRDLRHLSKVDFGVRIDGATALQLLAALQLVCRHPEFKGHSRATAERFARLMQQQISVTKNLAAVAAAGWGVSHAGPMNPGGSEPEPLG